MYVVDGRLISAALCCWLPLLLLASSVLSVSETSLKETGTGSPMVKDWSGIDGWGWN